MPATAPQVRPDSPGVYSAQGKSQGRDASIPRRAHEAKAGEFTSPMVVPLMNGQDRVNTVQTYIKGLDTGGWMTHDISMQGNIIQP